jgi:hypothetical protein
VVAFPNVWLAPGIARTLLSARVAAADTCGLPPDDFVLVLPVPVPNWFSGKIKKHVKKLEKK